MPVVVRSAKVGKRPVVKERQAREDLQLELASELSEPLDDLLQYSMLLYGEKKIGKTSLASMFPDTQFLMTEPGYKALRILPNWCPTWPHITGYTKLLEDDSKRSKPKVKTVVVDIVDRAYDLCFSYMCRKLAITHPQDEEDFGKSWGAIRKEFESWCGRLLGMNKGVIFISHAAMKNVTRRDGTKYDTLQPSLTGQPMAVLTGLVDTIAYYGYNGNERQLIIRGDDNLSAGTRIEEHFLTKVKRRPIHSISMGTSKQEAYSNLVDAFNNMSTNVGEVPTIAPRSNKRRR